MWTSMGDPHRGAACCRCWARYWIEQKLEAVGSSAADDIAGWGATVEHVLACSAVARAVDAAGASAARSTHACSCMRACCCCTYACCSWRTRSCLCRMALRSSQDQLEALAELGAGAPLLLVGRMVWSAVLPAAPWAAPPALSAVSSIFARPLPLAVPALSQGVAAAAAEAGAAAAELELLLDAAGRWAADAVLVLLSAGIGAGRATPPRCLTRRVSSDMARP